MPQRTNATTTLTVDEAQRAIYIDFEGREGHAPVLLGAAFAEGKAARDDRVVLRHYLLDGRMAELPVLRDIDGVARCDTTTAPMQWALRDVLLRAAKQDRMVVSYSRHEDRVIRDLVGDADTLRLFDALYRDGKATAKRWAKTCRPDLQLAREFGVKYRLVDLLAEVGYGLPPTYGKGLVGSRIKAVFDGIERRPGQPATAVQKAKWTNVLTHNAHDVIGLRRLMITATMELMLDGASR